MVYTHMYAVARAWGTHMEAKWRLWLSCSVRLFLSLLRQGLSLRQGLCWQSASPYHCPVSTTPQHRHTDFSHGSWGLNSGLHICSANALSTEPSLQPILALLPTQNRKLKQCTDWVSLDHLYKEPDWRICNAPPPTPICSDVLFRERSASVSPRKAAIFSKQFLWRHAMLPRTSSSEAYKTQFVQESPAWKRKPG